MNASSADTSDDSPWECPSAPT